MEGNQLTLEQPALGENRRCATRHRIITLAYIDLGSNNGGTLINISDEGLSFQGIVPLEPGQVLHVGIKLPGTDQSFKATGQVAWLNDSGKGGGLQFIELPEHARNLIIEWVATMSDDCVHQPASLPPHNETEKDYSSAVLRSLVQRNRPSADPSVEINKTLADLLHDASLSRDAAIAAVNASRSETSSAHPIDSPRIPRFPNPNHVTENVKTKLSIGPLRLPLILTLSFLALVGITLFQHNREQAVSVSYSVSGSASGSASGDSPLGLKVERAGEDWQVRWNRNSDVIANAVSGSLSITDGPLQKQLEIDISELRSGSILYTPATDDVTLRLQVVTEHQAQPVSETVRMISGKAR